MRAFLFAAATLLGSLMLPAGSVEAAPFCSYIGSTTGSFQSCAYRTWDQCLVAIRGAGGFCMINPADAWRTQGARARP